MKVWSGNPDQTFIIFTDCQAFVRHGPPLAVHRAAAVDHLAGDIA